MAAKRAVSIYASKYSSPRDDFNNLVKLPQFSRTLFLFNDNTDDHATCMRGGGNASARVMNRYSSLPIPKSAGIITGTLMRGGYENLSSCQHIIDECFNEIEDLLSTGNYDSVLYSVNSYDSFIVGNGIFRPSPDVLKYITGRILGLGETIFTLDDLSKGTPVTEETIQQILG
jgi:hypothetical protein